ncbi:MAG: 12-oxophytodienoate reductase [Sphingomonadales bacterium]
MAEPSSAAPSLEGLLSPLRIKGVTLRNRFVMPGMQRGWAEDGAPSAEMPDYYRRRVLGGVALIISESCAIDHPSATVQPIACRLDASTFDAWSRCVDAVRGAGGEMLLQLWHEGGLRRNDDGLSLSPSGLAYPGREGGRPATRDDLAELKDAYVRSALLAQRAGATGVELHCAHGYLLDQFLWPATNLRDDGYGGPLIADRIRFPAELVAAIRQACGDSFLISLRFSQWKEHDYSARVAATPQDLAEMVAILEGAGVDLLHASTRRFWTPEWADIDDLGLAGWTRAVGGLPTITVGSVGLSKDVMESFTTEGEASATVSQSLAELALRFARGEFDLVSIGRSLISDPDWVSKAAAGDYAAIRPFRKQDIAAIEQWES